MMSLARDEARERKPSSGAPADLGAGDHVSDPALLTRALSPRPSTGIGPHGTGRSRHGSPLVSFSRVLASPRANVGPCQKHPRKRLAFPPSAGHMVMRLEVDGGRSVAPTRSAGRCRAWSAAARRCSG